MDNQVRLTDVFPMPEEAKKLRVFLGEWRAKGTLSFDGRDIDVRGTVKASTVAAAWGVLVIGKLEIEGLGEYEEADLLTFEQGASMFHYFSVTNTGAAYDHRGKWASDSKIDFLFEGHQRGMPYSENLTFYLPDLNHIVVHESDTLDGKVYSVMDVVLSKQG